MATQKRLRQRMARIEQAASQSVGAVPALNTSPPAEVGVLAGELAAAFGELVKCYRERYALSKEEAVARASESDPAYEAQVLHGPPDQVSWFALDDLARRDPALALHRWEEVKGAAREELVSGHRAARAMEGFDASCWQRARFLAIYDDLVEGWLPQNGLERQLIGLMAQAQVAMLAWREVLTAWTALASWDCKQAHEGRKQHEPPRLSDAEAVERAAGMVERFHRMFLQTLRALRDLRRHPSPLVIRHAQVNIGEKQINLTS